jgi:hypothetical protein
MKAKESEMKKREKIKKFRKKSFDEKIVAESFFEILTMVISIFAFAFIIGGMVIGASPKVSADGFVPQGCCIEAKDGSICQEMNEIDKDNCKTGLVATDCDLVENCQIGCCYNKEEGICSLNSPKEKCEKSGGNWTKNPTCNIQECQLGCCVLGDQASITTSRECTKISQEMNFQKNFQPLDADGSCRSKIGLTKKGACIWPSDDFSGENECKFTTKEQCKTGSFYEEYLCTARELNTTCKPSKNTTCIEGKDQVYFVDTCNNPANVYDASRFSDSSYWEKIIPPEQSCSPASRSCGNCDYMKGSRCYEYRQGKDPKPVFGDYVCRDLNCANGRKHGESWCIADYKNIEIPGVAPVGSRWFRGVCNEGEITIEPCADFNQEICIQNTGIGDRGTNFTEAKCVVNQWRSCLAANEKESYAEVEAECKKYPDDCVMFLDIPGNEKYEGLPGFKKDKINTEQGNAGDVGKDQNKVLVWCVPKYTPGMVFWNTNSSGTQKNTGIGYGGSYEETKAICSLGSFNCVSHTQKKPATTGSWKDKENWECNWNAEEGSHKEENSKVPLLMEALNERCRMIGPCGVYTNIESKLGSNNGSSVIRTKIDKNGKTHSNLPITGYELPKSYLKSLSEKPDLIKAGSLTRLTAAVIMLITGKATEEVTQQAQASVFAAAEEAQQRGQLFTIATGGLGALALMAGGGAAGTFATAGTVLTSGIITSGSVTVATSAGTQILVASQTTPIIITTSGGITTATMTTTAGTTITATGTVTAGGYAGTAGGAAGISGASGTGLTTAGGAPTAGAGLGAAVSVVGWALAAAAASYIIGQLIGKWAGMSPGETQALSYSLAAAGAYLGAYISYNMIYNGAVLCGPYAGLCFLIALIIAGLIYSFTGEDNEYYTMQYTCEPWTPPEKGDCSLCNNDIRPCSEYRCRSLGLNCHYYNDNGEPGWCAEISEIWSAKITPWKEALSEGNKYVEIKENGFKIEGSGKDKKVEAWKPLQFGIITDKPAVCKIDNKHTKTYDEMAVTMAIDPAMCATPSCNLNQGTHHKVVLSQNLGNSSVGGGATLGMVEGENNYYIRCKNFAGQVNEAEFAVKVIVDSGPDLTPPIITGFTPVSGSYLKVGTNSSSLVLSVNEPAECRYSRSFDSRYEDMTENMTCLTAPSMASLGNWPCFTTLKNLTVGENKFYFQCQDKPDLPAGSPERRNINRNSKEYIVEVCSTELNITKLEPKNKIITGKIPVAVTLEAETAGCVEGGKAVCYYKFENGSEIAFLNTNSRSHTQPFTNIIAGLHNITIRCEDEAGNFANDSISVSVFLDNEAPNILRTYILNQKINIITDEPSDCKFIDNSSIGCSFNYESDNATLMEGINVVGHSAPWAINKDYFIKCRDIYNNTNLDCGIILRTY